MVAVLEFDAYKVGMVPTDQLPELWPQVEPYIARALEHDYDGMTTNQVLGRLLMQQLDLIMVTRYDQLVACMTLEPVQRNKRILHCMTFAGDDMEGWVDDFMAYWKEIAKKLDCQYISIKGRKGWERYAAKRFGFTHAYTQMFYEIKEDD